MAFINIIAIIVNILVGVTGVLDAKKNNTFSLADCLLVCFSITNVFLLYQLHLFLK